MPFSQELSMLIRTREGLPITWVFQLELLKCSPLKPTQTQPKPTHIPAKSNSTPIPTPTPNHPNKKQKRTVNNPASLIMSRSKGWRYSASLSASMATSMDATFSGTLFSSAARAQRSLSSRYSGSCVEQSLAKSLKGRKLLAGDTSNSWTVASQTSRKGNLW